MMGRATRREQLGRLNRPCFGLIHMLMSHSEYEAVIKVILQILRGSLCEHSRLCGLWCAYTCSAGKRKKLMSARAGRLRDNEREERRAKESHTQIMGSSHRIGAIVSSVHQKDLAENFSLHACFYFPRGFFDTSVHLLLSQSMTLTSAIGLYDSD